MARNRKRQTTKKTTVARKAGHLLSARVGTLNSPSPTQARRRANAGAKLGRPVLCLSPRIDATPDELVDAMFRLTPEQAKDIRERRQAGISVLRLPANGQLSRDALQ